MSIEMQINDVQAQELGITSTDGLVLEVGEAVLIAGPKGDKGDTGYIFTPKVDEQGNLSWSNNGGLPNPDTVNIRGERGEAFTYDDFTPEQLAGLVGPQGPEGPQGERGEPFEYEDFTAEQLEALTGPQGPVGPAGATGQRGEKGDTGEQGPTGPTGPAGPRGYKGDKGDPFTYSDFTSAQLAALKGPQGETGPAGADGQKGADGYSPTVSVTTITGGHRVTITDKNGPKSFDVMDGEDGQAAEGGGTVDIESVEAEKVVFTRDMYSAYAIGNIELDNGRGKYASAGDTLVDALDAIFDKETPPTVTKPSLSVTFSGVTTYEVGDTADISYSATFNPGSYSFGPATGVTVTKWSATDGKTTKATASGSFSRLMEDGTSFTMKVSADHGAGAVPLTNKGNAYAAGKIAAGTVSRTSGTINSYRNTFYGTLTEKSALTPSVIRGLTKSGRKLSNGGSFNVGIPVGAMRVVIAYPATLRDLTAVKDQNDSNSNIVSSFTKTTMDVEGYDGYEAISYKVYTLDFASAYDTANTYSVTI